MDATQTMRWMQRAIKVARKHPEALRGGAAWIVYRQEPLARCDCSPSCIAILAEYTDSAAPRALYRI